MLSDSFPVCLSCLSVTLVYCGQTFRWIKMKLGMEVGLDPGTLCYMDPSPLKLLKKGGKAAPPTFWLVLWPNGWMDHGTTWNGGRLLSPGHLVLDGDPACPQRGTPLQFSAHVCCGQTAGWFKMPLGVDVDLGPGDIVYGDPAPPKAHTPPFLERWTAAPLFSARSIAAKAKRLPISATAEHLINCS